MNQLNIYSSHFSVQSNIFDLLAQAFYLLAPVRWLYMQQEEGDGSLFLCMLFVHMYASVRELVIFLSMCVSELVVKINEERSREMSHLGRYVCRHNSPPPHPSNIRGFCLITFHPHVVLTVAATTRAVLLRMACPLYQVRVYPVRQVKPAIW